MSDNKPVITAEEFSTWLTPAAALKYLGMHIDYNDAKGMILTRLQAGLLESIAETVFIPEKDVSHQYQGLPKKTWTSIPDDFFSEPFWRTGDFSIIAYSDVPHVIRGTVLRFIGVRFEPTGVHALLPNSILPEQHTAGQSNTKDEQSPKGPPVADSLLEKWCDLYLSAYPGSANTLALARQSVDGMFPGKHVTRQRLRDVLERRGGARARGRKSNSTDKSAN